MFMSSRGRGHTCVSTDERAEMNKPEEIPPHGISYKLQWGLTFSQTHHEILLVMVKTREHVPYGERPPGDVCNESGHVVHPGHHHQPHK
eukprot:764748-Pelagomonas_calceolata.AAC.1